MGISKPAPVLWQQQPSGSVDCDGSTRGLQGWSSVDTTAHHDSPWLTMLPGEDWSNEAELTAGSRQPTEAQLTLLHRCPSNAPLEGGFLSNLPFSEHCPALISIAPAALSTYLQTVCFTTHSPSSLFTYWKTLLSSHTSQCGNANLLQRVLNSEPGGQAWNVYFWINTVN